MKELRGDRRRTVDIDPSRPARLMLREVFRERWSEISAPALSTVGLPPERLSPTSLAQFSKASLDRHSDVSS
jgi:hypothetical protein